MKAAKSGLPREWAAKVANHKIIYGDDLQTEAVRNMLVFPLSEIQSLPPASEDLSRFLMLVFHDFCLKAARSKFVGWFYAWFDEMSGTLRCSACSVQVPDELPFSCDLRIVDVPYEVARAAANSPYISGIPWAEFQEVETRDEGEIHSDFELTVFARRLVRSA